MGVVNFKFSPAFTGGSEILNLHFSEEKLLAENNSKDYLSCYINACLKRSIEVSVNNGRLV